MGLFQIFNIASSGMDAQSIRLNTTASNMANAETVSGSQETAYKARYPVFQTVLDNANFDSESYEGDMGVKVSGIYESNSPAQPRYQPEHPLANKDGYVFLPGVNVIEEMANMISASRAYQTNIEVLNATKQMLQRTLTLGQ